MPNDALIGRLVDDLAPVRPRRWRSDALVLGVVALAELAAMLLLVPMPADVAAAMMDPLYGWKLGASLALALAGGAAALLALDPVANLGPARRALRWLAGGAAAVTLLLAGATMGEGDWMRRLDWHDGLECLAGVALFGLPVTGAFIWLARRAAPTALGTTAFAAGLAGGGWGAFVFAWRCPHVDPLYLLVWYGGAIGLATLLARRLLPGLLRW